MKPSFGTIIRYLQARLEAFKSILPAWGNKEVLTFFLFFLLAAFCWFLQTTQSVAETTLTIPLSYRKLPEHISITNEPQPSIQVTLRGKGSHLYGYALHRKQLGLDIDLMNWHNSKGIGRISLKQLEPMLLAKMKPSTQILRIVPDSMLIYFVEKEGKEVFVKLNSEIHLAPQHMLSHAPELHPAFVTAYAPKGLLDTLVQIETMPLKIDHLKDSIEIELALKPIEGVQFSQEKIRVAVPVEAFTEASFMVEIEGIGLPKNTTLRAFPQKAKVSFLVSESAYGSIKAEDFSVVVDYRNWNDSPDGLQPLVLKKQPIHIRRPMLQPDKVECLIERN